MDIHDEITHAISSAWKTSRGCCLSHNETIHALRLHGSKLLIPVEKVVPALELPADRRSQIRRNLVVLLRVYFEIAHDHDHEPTQFVMSLTSPAFQSAVESIHHLWGTNSRRRWIWKSLYDHLKSKIADSDRVASLVMMFNRLMVAGMLTFDLEHPGSEHPPARKYKSVEEMFEHMRLIQNQVRHLSR